MKKSEIVVGGTYSNGKGRERKVIAEGADYKPHDRIWDDDYIRYEIVNDGTARNRTAGDQHNMTRQAFSAWATGRIDRAGA